jgi:predicted outer membrane repeat protein
MSVKQTSIYLKRRNLTCLALLLLVIICLSSCTPAAAINVACDVGDLIDAVNDANANSDTTRLILEPNCIYPFTNKDNSDGGQGPNALPIVTTKIVIEGNNAILLRDTGIGFRFFFINNSGNLRLEDISLENGYALAISVDQANSRGGAIYNDGGGFRAERSVFLDNHAWHGEGGAIYNLGVLTLDETTFEINSSGFGGAIYQGGTLGTIAVIENVTFDRNFANDNGGAIYNATAEANFLITGSTFNDNHSYEFHGGAIYMEAGNLDISNSDFLQNTSGSNAYPTGDGGAIYSPEGNVSLITSNFIANRAYGTGGLIHAGPGSDVRLRKVWSEDSVACHGGGALFVEGDTDVQQTTLKLSHIGGWSGWNFNISYFDECSGHHGGAIYNTGTLAIDSSLLERNWAIDGDSDGVYNLGDLTVVNSTFHHNMSYNNVEYRREAVNNQGNADLSFSTFVYSSLVNSGTMTVKDIVVAGNINGCINSGTFVDIDENIAFNPTCPFSIILANFSELNIDSALSDNGGPTLTHRVSFPSPVFNMATCSTVAGDPVNVDQRGVSRPIPPNSNSYCDIGAFEVDDFSAPPPPPPPLPPTPTLDSGPDPAPSCDPFEDLDISVVLLNVPPDTLVLPLYFRFPDLVPGQTDAEPSKFRAQLGNLESYKCDQQGFEDRLYCMFNLTPDVPGLALDLLLYKDDCEDPSYTLPKVTIPELKGSIPELKGSIPDPKLQCSKDLNKDTCEAAGGTMSDGVSEAPYCICP